jgi:putative ABC transport system permease protein
MFKNYLTTALRNIFKKKGFSLLNIFGLAIGIACCLLIFQYVSFERSYDNFPDNAKRIIRLRLDSYQQGKLSSTSAAVFPAFGPTMKKDFPEVEDFCRLSQTDLSLSNDERNIRFSEEKCYYADPSFLSMFSIQLAKGNPKTALSGPDKLLISVSMAKKYFASEDPLGKKLVYRSPNFTRIFEVTGVFKELPSNSHLVISHLISYATLASIRNAFGDVNNSTETSWGWNQFYTYLLLKPGTDTQKLESKFPAFCNRYINNLDWMKAHNSRSEVYMIPLREIHLRSHNMQEAEINGNDQTVSFLFLIALFIIGMAWINYVNLSTARSLERAKEVGVRKVIGAARKNLINQFLVEGILLNVAAFLIALCIAFFAAPWFSLLMGKSVQTGFSLPGKYWLLSSIIFLTGSVLSGIYPALLLSGFKPRLVLKGVFKNSQRGLILRRGLIILQFATSVVLIAGAIIVYQQVNYMLSQPLGVNIKQTLVLEGAHSVKDSVYQNIFQPFRNSILRLPAVKSIAASTSVMGKENAWANGIWRYDRRYPDPVTLYYLGIDYDFIPSYEMKFVAGRNFSKDFPTDIKTAILNETAVKLLGFESPQDAINEKIVRGDTLTIIGVVQNFHNEGLHKSIDPYLIILRPNTREAYSIKIESANISSTIGAIQTTWNKYFSSDPFNYYFLDELFDQQYKTDRRFGKIFGLFALIAIIIACFGLLGLSAYNVLQRTKEIGIRKVLGASVQHVLYILSKDFIILVLISFVVAIPVTWGIMSNWLQDFAYRITIQWWVFILAAVVAVLIAFLTVSTQAIKAALTNPVKSLRTE